MVKVAIAGGTRGLGAAIAKGIEASQSHECVVLSRSPTTHPGHIFADYSDTRKLRDLLEAQTIHTVISVLAIEGGGGEAQLNLLEAADQCHATKRFMPSEFGALYEPEHVAAEMPAYTWKLKARDRLENSSLEYTLLSNSVFLDYLIAPRVPTPLTFALPLWIDLENNFAALPGDGNTMVTMTHTRDIVQFVVAYLSMADWQKQLHLLGDRLTLNEIVEIAEEIKGTNFEKHFDDIELLRKGECTVMPVTRLHFPSSCDEKTMRELFAVGSRIALRGCLDLDPKISANKLVPDLKTLTVRDAIQLWNGTKVW